MRTMTRAFTAALAVLLIASCTGCVSVGIGSHGATGSVQGKGAIVTVDFPVDAFDKIDVDSTLGIVYKNGPCAVQMTLHENLAEYMDITVKDGMLTVKSTKYFRVGGDRQPVLTVTAPTLSEMHLAGTVDMENSDTITADRLTLDLAGGAGMELSLDVNTLDISASGAADLDLTGRADVLVLNGSGACTLDAIGLESKTASINLSGAGDAAVNCSDVLEVTISGAGSVRYKGTPEVIEHISGLGDINQIRG